MNSSHYLKHMQALLPIGSAWPKHKDATLTKVLDALAVEFSRIDARASALQQEVIPTTTTELISEWEQTVGLPDPCVGKLEDSIARRRLAVQAKLTAGGSGNPNFYVQLAAAMGYAIEITEPALHTWQIDMPEAHVTFLTCGNGVSGDPLADWGDDFFECLFQRIKPAHTVLNIIYGGYTMSYFLSGQGASGDALVTWE